MVIDFSEKKFISIVKEMVEPFGLDKKEVDQIVSYALSAVRKASKPVK